MNSICRPPKLFSDIQDSLCFMLSIEPSSPSFLSSNEFIYTLQLARLSSLLLSNLCSQCANICSHGANVCPQRADLYSHDANRDLFRLKTSLLYTTHDFILWIHEVYSIDAIHPCYQLFLLIFYYYCPLNHNYLLPTR